MTRKHPAHVITNDSVTGSAEIERSLKFHDGDSVYLSRTLVVQAIEKHSLFLVGLKEVLLELKVVLF